MAACGGRRPQRPRARHRPAEAALAPSRGSSARGTARVLSGKPGKGRRGAAASPPPRKPQRKPRRVESGAPRYHPGPHGRSGSAQRRLAPEHAVDEAADDAQRAEGHLQQPQQHHVALVEDEVPVTIHSAPAGRSADPGGGPARQPARPSVPAAMGGAQQTRTDGVAVERFNICIASVAQLKRSLKFTYYKCFSSLCVVRLCCFFIFFSNPRNVLLLLLVLLPCTYTQTHYKNLIRNIKGRAIVSHVNIFLRVIHF